MLPTALGQSPPPSPPQGSESGGDWIWSVVANAWEWVGDQQATIVALATVLTAIIAIVALRSTASDSRERSRPIVLAFFRLAPHNDSAFDLVVHNYGTSAAADIDVTFDPPFGESERQDHMIDALAQRYEKRVPLLPPGSEITNVWWALDFAAPSGSGRNRHATPDQAVVTITYKGNRIRRYKEKVKLDTNWMKGDTSTVSSTSRPGLDKQNAESLKKIAAESRAARLLLREVTDRLEGSRQMPATDFRLPEIIPAAAGDMTALAAQLGVSVDQAEEIVALVEREPISGEIEVVSGGQIAPGTGTAS